MMKSIWAANCLPIVPLLIVAVASKMQGCRLGECLRLGGGAHDGRDSSDSTGQLSERCNLLCLAFRSMSACVGLRAAYLDGARACGAHGAGGAD